MAIPDDIVEYVIQLGLEQLIELELLIRPIQLILDEPVNRIMYVYGNYYNYV